MSTSLEPPTPPSWFTSLLDAGFQLLHYPPKKKGPEGTTAIDWTSPTKRITSPDQYQPQANVGVFTGVEIAPGRYLADVDFDWSEGLPLANKLLPDTQYLFGRKSKIYSHAFYTTSHPLTRYVFEDLDKTVLVELRGTTDDGGIGWQTMIPPSVHPSGEVLEWRKQGEIGHHDTLLRRVQLYAVACLLFKYLGARGLLHDQRLALAGFLLQEGLSESEVIDVGEAIASATHNDVKDIRYSVRSTLQQLAKGEPVKGAGALAKAMTTTKDGSTGRDVIRAIRRFLGTQQFVENEKGVIIPNHQRNIRLALDKLHVSLTFNEFSHKMYAVNSRGTTLVDESMIIPLWMQIDEQFHFRPSKDFFVDKLRDEAWKRPLHPVRDYLASLTWDGTLRLDTWLQRYAGAADTAFIRAVGALTLLAAVRRVRQPGCKKDEMLILESPKQGTAKSSALAALCPHSEWFSDDLPLGVDAKQVIERTAGKWIIEASELHGHRQREADHMKAFLSRQVDGPVRLAYDRVTTEVPRQFILIGTTNTLTGYLKDFSGARRFWPVLIHAFRLDDLRRDRDQLWAEAAQREAQGESLLLPTDLWEDAEVQQEERRAMHPWEELLDTEDFFNREAIPVKEIWSTLGVQANARNNMHAGVISEIMQRHGFTTKERRYVEEVDEHSHQTIEMQTWCWVKAPHERTRKQTIDQLRATSSRYRDREEEECEESTGKD